ncbi:GNAT family N-acetyltransferase [Demequina capsici]|uniref:GNAT family N-acetyltransferase n=1 Tax=Demequina capsici TaxID=3075620 RepID=A0AA96F9H4_9MICO|nr:MULTISPECIES: GNAT family N-acetyltransferase [unclassified Demequina]WNM23391.1 GNAT family N-acetyltransferase [Demequina sp. OYTSA14]WNM26268.1 GNAT family N-acetyltransferase [Demequina sp. PMTSA13]
MSTPASPADTVRAARPGDEAAIARIQVESWVSALGERLGPRRHTAFDLEAVEQGWRQAISEPPSPGHQVFVALGDEGEIVGFVACAPPKDLIALEIAPDRRRRGHGSRLLAAAADHMRSHGARSMRLWSLEKDRVRVDFLKMAGFAEAGMRRELDGPGITIPEQLWHTDLTPEA